MATARVHITRAMQHLAILPAGVSPSTTDDEPDCLLVLNSMIGGWNAIRIRADKQTQKSLAEIASAGGGVTNGSGENHRDRWAASSVIGPSGGLGVSLNATPSRAAIDTGLPTYGAPVASASSIAPTGLQFHVTGTTTVNTITIPTGFVAGTICIIPDGVFALGTSGNVAIAATTVVGKAMYLTYDPVSVKWFPSY